MYQSTTLPPTPDTVETNYPGYDSSGQSVTTVLMEGGVPPVPPTEYQVNEAGHHVARPAGS